MNNNTETTEIFSEYEMNNTSDQPRELNTTMSTNSSTTTTRMWSIISTTKTIATVASSFNAVVFITLVVLIIILLFFTCRRIFIKLDADTDREENEDKNKNFLEMDNLDDFKNNYFEARHFDNGGSYEVSESKIVVRCK